MKAALACAALSAVLQSAPAPAQGFPAKPVRLVAPFSGGGAADTAARLVAGYMAERLGQPVVVDNRPGAGGIVGTEAVAKAPADGYTLLWVNSNHAINASLYTTLSYDTTRDFAPVSLVATTAFVLVAHPSLKAGSVADLVRIARAKPGEINYASLGNGSGAHFAAELFKIKTKIDMTHVPYKGVAQAVPELLAGTVSVMFPNIANAQPYVKAGRLRALAVTSAQRSALVPDVPTVQESGVRDYEFSNWLGVLAPAGTPAAVISRLGQAVAQIADHKDVQAAFAKDGATLVASTPEAFRAHLDREIAKYAALIAQIGLKRD
jgi:tripartite-type tricarboxylate transporter receptor subunit TctC